MALPTKISMPGAGGANPNQSVPPRASSIPPQEPPQAPPVASPSTLKSAPKPAGLPVKQTPQPPAEAPVGEPTVTTAEPAQEPETKRKVLTPRSRFVLKDCDMTILDFLGTVRYANRWVLSYLLPSIKPRTIQHRLDRLLEHGFVTRKVVGGYGSLYVLTRLGQQETSRDFRIVPPDFSTHAVRHTLELGRLHAQFLTGSDSELAVLGIPKTMRPVTEFEMNSSMYGQLELARVLSGDPDSTFSIPSLRAMKEAEIKTFAESGYQGTPPEQQPGSEWLLVPYASPFRDHHMPDMVLVAPARKGGKTPQNVAIEVELNAKSRQEYAKIFDFYKREFATAEDGASPGMLARVVWLVRRESAAQIIGLMAAKSGITAKQIKILLLDTASTWSDSQGGE